MRYPLVHNQTYNFTCRNNIGKISALPAIIASGTHWMPTRAVSNNTSR